MDGLDSQLDLTGGAAILGSKKCIIYGWGSYT